MKKLVLALLSTLACVVHAAYKTIQSEFNDKDFVRVKHFSKGEVCDTGADHYSGWVTAGHANLFFWYHEARHEKENKPLLLWLTGGPGGSGVISMLGEHGPCRAKARGNGTEYHPFAWTEAFNVIYIDQPVAAGFSYSDNGVLHNDSRAASVDLVGFLQLFIQAFPELRQRPLHISGESFGGRSVPLLAATILEYNNLITKPEYKIPLKSIMLGNGWTWPRFQYPSMYEVGCHEYRGMGKFFNETECEYSNEAYDRCQTQLEACEAYPGQGAVCRAAGQYCENAFPWDRKRRLKKYDRRKECPKEGSCYPRLSNAENWVNSAKVREIFEIQDQTGRHDDQMIEIMSDVVFRALVDSGDYFKSSMPEVKQVLDFSSTKQVRHGDSSVDVLFYAGVADIPCNPLGVTRLVENIKWKYHGKWMGTAWKELQWRTIEGGRAGRTKGINGLHVVELEGAGHQSPEEQPESLLNLIKWWLAMGESRDSESSASSNLEGHISPPRQAVLGAEEL